MKNESMNKESMACQFASIFGMSGHLPWRLSLECGIDSLQKQTSSGCRAGEGEPTRRSNFQEMRYSSTCGERESSSAMPMYMRTTIDVPDKLLERVRPLLAERDASLK